MPQPDGNRLDSWKEIAAHLGRDERTVRRWEKEKGLPVHRVPGGERKAVFAYPVEIDAWLHKPDSLNGVSSLGEAVPRELFPVGPIPEESRATDFPAIQSPISTATHTGSSSWWRKPVFTLRRATFAVVLLALFGVMAFSMILINARPVADRLDRVNFSGNSLQAWSPEGELLWTYSFHQPLNAEESKRSDRILIADSGEAGEKQVLVMVPFLLPEQPNSPSDAAIALSSSDKLVWRHDFTDTFQFAGNRYGPPWYLGAALVTHEGLDSYVWSAADSQFWSPSTLIKLDHDGHPVGEFVNWGHIHVLSQFRSAQGSFILAGGINNQCNCAMLAVLREDQPSGSSPGFPTAKGAPEFHCDDCPPGKPYRYVLFPRSEVNVPTGATYNQVLTIQAGDREIRVGVRETGGGSSLGADWKMYQLSPDFVPQTFAVSDHFLLLHRELEAQGEIRHKLENCPELHGAQPVKVWSQDGWQEALVRPVQ